MPPPPIATVGVLAQGAEVGGSPGVGLGEQLTLAAFLVLMLVVPYVMAWDPSDARGLDEPGPAGTPRSLFASKRERRLWLLAGLVLLAIYVTLSPVAELAAALRARNLLRISQAAVLLCVVAGFAVPWAKSRPGRREIGAAVGVAAVYLTTLIRIPVPEARTHLFEYGLVAMLLYQALAERRRRGRRAPLPALTAVVAAALLGWVDEVIQHFLPARTYDLRDVGFNALAAVMAVGATLVIASARRLDMWGRIRRGLGR